MSKPLPTIAAAISSHIVPAFIVGADTKGNRKGIGLVTPACASEGIER